MVCVGKTRHRVAAAIACVAFPTTALADGDAFRLGATPIAAEGAVQQRSEPPLVTPPEPQHWAIGFGALYTHHEGETAAWLPNVEVNYSPSDRVQLHVMAPFVYDHLNGAEAHFGLGDVELGVRYRFMDDDPQGGRPAIAIYPLVDLPSGRQRENLGTGRIHLFLPLWFSKTFGSWIP